MGIRKEPATVTRRLSESLDFALMPLGFNNQRLLAREWPLYPRRRFDTLHRPDNCAAGLAGWQLRCPYLPGHQAFALTSAGRGAHRHDESLPGSSNAGPSPSV